MSHATRLVVAAALALAASNAYAFTIGDQSTSGTLTTQGGSNFGGTLTDPGSQIRTYQGLDLSTANGSTTTQEGFSFRFGAGPMGSETNRRLAPPAWSTDPLYLERDH